MPTSSGLATLISAVGLAALAVGTGYPQLAALAAGCAAVLVLAWITAPAPRLAITADWVDAKITEDRAGVLRISASCGGRQSAPTTVVLRLAGPDGYRWRAESVVPPLTEGGVHSVRLETEPLARGRYHVMNLTAECTDLLGLVRRRQRVASELPLLARPRTLDLTDPSRAAADSGRPRGPRRSGDVFHGLRDYQPGDDVRLIHWMATARTGLPVIRELLRVDVRRHAVLLDTSAGRYRPGSFDTAVRVAASLARAAAADDDAWLLTTDGQCRHCPAGDSDAVLDPLAAIETGPRHDDPVVPRQATNLTVVTGPEPDRERWHALAGRREVMILAVGDGPDLQSDDRGIRVRRVTALDDLPGLMRQGRR